MLKILNSEWNNVFTQVKIIDNLARNLYLTIKISAKTRYKCMENKTNLIFKFIQKNNT